MFEPLPTFVVEFAVVHAETIGAADIDKAAAVAQAIAETYGYRLLGIYHKKFYEDRNKAESIEPKGAPSGTRTA